MTNNIKDLPFEELRRNLSGELHTDTLRRVMLSTDGGLYQVAPAAVIYPNSTNDIVVAVNFAQKHGIAIHARGAGSGLCGSAIGDGIVVDFSKYMNKMLHFDPELQEFTCEPGYKYGELERLLKGTGLFWPPSPSSGEYATFGGMFNTNAGGGYSVKYGNVADYLIDAEVVFADGTVRTLSDIAATPTAQLPAGLKGLYDLITKNSDKIKGAYPDIPCNVCGYELRHLTEGGRLNLHKLLGGSEGTLGIVTKLKFKVVKKPIHSTLIVAYFNDILSAAKAAQLALTRSPAGIEIMDKSLLRVAREQDPSLRTKIPDGFDNVLMFEFESDSADEVKRVTEACIDEIKEQNLSPNISIALTEADMAQFWAVRKAAVPILYLLKGRKKILPLVEDAAVPVDRLVAYFHGLYEIFERHDVQFVLYGHIAKGLLHSRPLLDMKDAGDIDLLRVIADDVFMLVKGLGGTISGEHGDGRVRSCYIPLQYGDLFDTFLSVKDLLDPNRIFNPDIITSSNPNQMKENLRYGKDYDAKEIDKSLLIWEDGMAVEVEKCHGCSKCTTVTVATRMCPAYKATRDEASAPKAKANLLRALISGKIQDKELYSSAFKFVMDRCLNCGSCTKECPSQVNIPKMALEAKSQYVRKFGSPLEHKIVTNFELFGRYTRKLFPIVTPIMRIKAMRKIVEKTAGVASEREFIKFNTKSLYDRLSDVVGSGDKKALYFAGCYASYVRPDIGVSTVSVLNKLGYQVFVPEQHCCGIPHLSKGMAEGTRDKIEDNLKSWGKLLDEADVIVVSCSSCGLSLTKEWGYYIGGELIEKVKRKTKHVSQLINDIELKTDTPISVAYHSPCHMRLMPDPTASLRVLSSIDGVKAVSLSSSCCGMAGSWGMSASHYEESVKIGTPMVMSLIESDCNICATDCPTCEMQLKHLSDKPIMHPVEIVDSILQ
ncbi:MAG: FAD-binding protein [Deferribacteraceae bacterium]|jgi:FAD/FMN-containing dehydrogenase/Fe-S oxidoreductase|nr:FAD-binding protein [Deferribacteraceae bacterium]